MSNLRNLRDFISWKLIIQTITLCASICVSVGQFSTPFKCTVPQASDSNSVTRFDPTPVCLTFNNQTRASFNPDADDYSMFNINGSFAALPPNTGIFKENSGWQSDINITCSGEDASTRYFVVVEVTSYDAAPGFSHVYQIIDCANQRRVFFPVITAIVHVIDGEAQYITWDEGCLFCATDSDQCQPAVYDTTINQLVTDDVYKSCGTYCDFGSDCNDCSDNKCDLKMYVVWTGTDKNGAFFESAGVRFSRFRSYGIGSLYNSAEAAVQAGVNGAEKAAGDVQNLPNNF